MEYAIVEKKNRCAIHGIFDTIARADYHLNQTIPDYIAKSYFMDKTLTTNDFEIIEYKAKQ